MKTTLKTTALILLILLFVSGNPSPTKAAGAAPTNVQASDGYWANFVKITWGSTYTAGFHRIFRSTAEDGIYTFQDSVPFDQYYFNDTTATPGTTYFYYVDTCIASDCTVDSGIDSGWRGYINTVTSISAGTGSAAGTFVAWSTVSGADYYEVYRSISLVGTKYYVGETTNAFLLDDLVSPASAYYYWVLACTPSDQCGEFADSDSGQRAWPVVENVTASDGGYANSVQVDWDTVSGATGYQVFYRQDGAVSWLTPAVYASPPVDQGIAHVARDYEFAVTPCFDAACGTTKSTTTVGWADFAPPATVSATEFSTNGLIQLSWTEVPADPVIFDAWYFVLRDFAVSPSGAVQIASNGASENFSDSLGYGAISGKAYDYWIAACPYTATTYTDKGCSQLQAATTSGSYYPSKPGNLTASDGTSASYIQIDWDAVSGATYYTVYRSLDPFATTPVWTALNTPTANTYKDYSAADGIDYYYRVKACGPEFCGELSGHDSGYLERICYSLTLDSVGGGNITPDPTETNGCPTGEYIEGETVELVSVPDDSTWYFDSWTNTDNDTVTSSLNYITMPASTHTVTATFNRICYPLDLDVQGSGTLEVTSPTASTGCSAGNFVEGEVVNLLATPASGWTVFGWTGADTLTTSTTNTVTMPNNTKQVTVIFEEDTGPSYIFTDGFESGDLLTWTRFNDGSGFMDACTAGKITGNWGACVTRGSNDKRKQLIDDTPANETTFSARFNFDINNLSMANGERFRFMQFKMDAERPAFIVLKYQNGQYQVQLNTLLDDLTKVKTSWYVLPNAPITIEVEWQQSSGANDGYVSLYFDDALKETLPDLDNDSIEITSFRMGFTSRLGGKSINGTFYIDDVATSNGGKIGLP